MDESSLERSLERELSPLPLGESSFSALRESGEIYVDKTRMVYELARQRSRIFLARPRRFGKSLLVSTFYSLFEYGLRDFSGLAIENLWEDDKKYSVIALDFSFIKSFESSTDFKEQLNDYLLNSLLLNGLVTDNFPSGAKGIVEFSKWLKKQPNNSVVLLIDEYDAPLASCLNEPDTFIKVKKAMISFYSAIKGNSGVFRFLFMTGIMKFGNAGIFSDLNSLDDITLVPAYGNIVGYSLKELKHYFGSYITQASKALNLSESKLIEELVANYNGFCFEETATKKVFAPWSVLNFFKRPNRGFINYWFESGGQPSVLMEYVKEHTLLDPSTYSRDKSIYRSELSVSTDSNELDEKVLLVQTGYLTIKKWNKKEDTLLLGYPNREVAKSMAVLCLSRLLKGQTLSEINAGRILHLIAEGNVKEFIKRINNVFFALDYNRYFIKDEKTCQGAFLLILQGAGIQAHSEIHNALGRSDIEFTVANTHWVIEIKYARPDENALDLLPGARKQVKARHYGEQDFGKKLVRLVLVFSGKERHFVEYCLVDSKSTSRVN